MKRCLQSVLILSLLALISAPAFAVGPCWQVCTCSASCSQRCVDPDGRGTTCFNGWDCIGSCQGAQPADPIQEQRADANLWVGQGDLCTAPAVSGTSRPVPE